MLRLTYQDAYKQTKSQEFEDLDAILLAFSSCITLPDYLKVLSLTEDEKDLGYTGSIGELYSFLQTINQERRLKKTR
ncbi:DUF4649 family protein [Streptococcus oriscaviae]|uniref:DUF4649 family protein n=1 Tax=Streptococcus oriscaviae TaxID=2781599 RepID=A0ABX7YLY6_9STRE|nr:DUF4649 family protein [Streptococcus oriscaviae]QUE54698.1 DUF4649 family protein [Streptococcus oriscaviae]